MNINMETILDFNWSAPDIQEKALISLIKAGDAIRTRVQIILPTGGVFEKIIYKVKPNPRQTSWKYLPPELRSKLSDEILSNKKLS